MANEIWGARDTAVGTQALRKLDIRDEILKYDPDATPLTVITSRLNSAATVNPEFKWYEKDRPTRRTTTTTTGTGTTVAVPDLGFFQEHDIWRNTTTGENIRVVTVPGSSGAGNITVVRGASPVAFTSGDELLRVGVAQPEGDTSKEPKSRNETPKTNYTQIFRTPYAATRTWQQSETLLRRGDWEEIASDAWLEHMLDIEATALWGVARETLTGDHPRRETGGAYHFITTNVVDVGGAMTEAEFFAGFESLFRYSSSGRVKFAFSGGTPLSVVNGYARGKLEVVQADDDDTYGVSISKYRGPEGTLNFVRHQLMADSTEYAKHILVLDLMGNDKSAPRKRYLTGGGYGDSDTHIRENIQEPDRDGRKDEILTEAGWEWGLEKRHGYYKNVTS
jgi:hypothetical protein